MMHPHSTCKEVNDIVGLGVFATHDIPKGTIINVESELDIRIDHERYGQLSSECRSYVDSYAYLVERGGYRINWDHARYMNHCCFANTLCTAYDFEIAIEDIKKGEQITCDYRLFNHKCSGMRLSCQQKGCLETLKYFDMNQHIKICDGKIKSALYEFTKVPQPLLSTLDINVIRKLYSYLENADTYESLLKSLRSC